MSLLEENVLGGFCTGGKLGRKICQEENDREDSVTQSYVIVRMTFHNIVSSKVIIAIRDVLCKTTRMVVRLSLTMMYTYSS